jgi:squalene synthase HpnC
MSTGPIAASLQGGPQALTHAGGGVAVSRRENFPVLTPLLSRELRRSFAAVYGFCRCADDAADRPDPDEATAMLRALRRDLDAALDGRHTDPAMAELRGAIERHRLPGEAFHRLLDAFEQDQIVRGYPTWDDLLDYCRGSANPVGEVVLRMGGHTEADPLWERLLAMSDHVCTALQLANFWQDVRRDLLDLGRVYIPQDAIGIEPAMLRAWADGGGKPESREEFSRILRPLLTKTDAMLNAAAPLHTMVDRSIARPVWLFQASARLVLRRIEAMGCLTLWSRPRVPRWRLGLLVLCAAAGLRGSRP